MPNETIIGYAGFDFVLQFDLSDAIPAGTNLVGKTAIFSMKKDRKSPDTDATLKKDFVIAPSNLDTVNAKILIVKFSATEMLGIEENNYYFDLKLFNSDGSGLVYIPYQEVEIIDDVSNRVSI